jgi:methionine synthase II (cobalamin-independent)
MTRKDMFYPEAVKYVKDRRKVINPNSGFKRQLYDYGKSAYKNKLK